MEHENGLDALEARIRKAADLIQQLRQDRSALRAELDNVRERLASAEKRSQTAQKERGADTAALQKVDALTKEVQTLRHERDEVRARIEKLVSVLEELDS